MTSRLVLLALICFAGYAADIAPEPRFADPNRRAKLEKAFPEIDRIFERFLERGAPGLVYGVIVDGQLAHVQGLGVRDRSAGDVVSAGTVFRIASMTKSFTALAILKLRDEGKLSLEDPVSKWIPELARLRYPTRDSAPLIIRDLLTHSAGFPEDNPWGDRQLAITEDVLTGWLKAGIPFSTPPQTEYEYSNYGFALLGRIVAKASGAPYRDYVEKRILAPLDMTASSLEPSAIPARLRATGYRRSGTEYSEEPSLAHGEFGAMGGLLTSASDLAKYVAFQLSAFPPRDEEDRGPVRRSSLREMQRMWRLGSFSGACGGQTSGASVSGYGYGLGVTRDCRFNHLVSHSGGLPGFGSIMMWLPEHGVGVIAMANLTYASPSQPAREALEAMRATGGLEPRQLPASSYLSSTRDAIVRLWNSWSDKAASELAADNLFLDTPAGQRRAEIEQLKAGVGACQAGDVRPENYLRGSFRMSCESGNVDVAFTLAPTMPPKVQYLRFTRSRQ